MGGRKIVFDSDDDTDGFSSPPPTASTRVSKTARTAALPAAVATPRARAKEAAAPKSTVRRRRLGPVQNDSALLQAWKVDEKDEKPSRTRLRAAKVEKQPKQHVELRTRRTRRISELPADDAGEISTEEATMLEDVHLGESDKNTEEEQADKDQGENDDDEEDDDDDEDDDDNDSSEFQDSPDDSSDSLGDFFPSPTLKKHIPAPIKKNRSAAKKNTPRASSPLPDDTQDQSSIFFSAEESLPDPLAKPMRQLSLSVPAGKIAGKTPQNPPPRSKRAAPAARPSTPPPPASPPRSLVSPSKKLPRIPMTPHAPTTDAFWDQQFVDDWNMEHSPRKLFTEKADKTEDTQPKAGSKAAAAAREAKKSFQKNKHETAERFLAELDGAITQGELARLAATTGGVRIVWTNKLNTTAGRANWRRETLRPKGAAATSSPVRILHHASIELAEKVIDDEHRLLNVLAHEFCHLANFMVSGITGNPHGREFKAWAAQCSRHFGARGIQVTTKHTYEIDFRYVWTCAECATQYKRHSKSIDPRRHRCGLCRGELWQTKPVPRGGGKTASTNVGIGSGAGAAPVSVTASAPKLPPAPSAYQKFMKENMAVLRRENPGSPQKEIMKMVAERWTQAKKEKQAAASGEAGKKEKKTAAAENADTSVVRLDKAFVDLTLTEHK